MHDVGNAMIGQQAEHPLNMVGVASFDRTQDIDCREVQSTKSPIVRHIHDAGTRLCD